MSFQEIAKEVISFLDTVKDESPDNVMTMYFVEKPSRDKFLSYRPQISNDLQKKILAMVLPPLVKSLQFIVVPYNPIGVADEENELLSATQVDKVDAFTASISDDLVYTEMSQIKISKIGFYCIQIRYHENAIFLFRQFSKMNRLRNSFVGQFFNNELKEMDSNFLAIDELTDMLLFDGSLLILNHISLERVFNYRDEYLRTTNAAIGEIVSQEIMQNVEQFSEDCKRDVRIMKRFTELMSKERLPLFFEHYDRVPEIVQSLGLDIEFDNDGKIIYREKSQLFHLINLMSDSYFRSLLADRIGIAKTEDVV